MRRVTALLGSVSIAFLARCSCNEKSSEAIEVTVQRGPGASSKCVIVSARSGTQAPQSTQPMAEDGGNLVVAVYPSATLSGTIQVTANGFQAADCTGAVVDTDTRSTAFVPGRVVPLTLILAPDGGCPVPPDCAQASCEGVPCASSSACTIGATCHAASGTCSGGATLACNQPPVCFTGIGTCLPDGGCSYSPADGGTPCPGNQNPCYVHACDGQGHCLDALLPDGTSCSGGTSCMTNGICDGGACAQGMPFRCTMPPDGGCFQSMGYCDAGVGCTYPPRRSGPCDDGNACTSGDSCQSTGVCQGAQKSCAPMGQCFDAGVCNPASGTCDYAVLVSAPCDAGDLCQMAPVCQASGACMGGAVTCPDAGPCYTANGCSSDAGCTYSPQSGGACDGGWGTCNAGTCVQSSLYGTFPYTPSNFDAGAVMVGGPVTVNCTLVIDTSPTASLPGTWCASPAPPLTVVTQTNGPDLAGFGMASLSVTDAGFLQFVGTRPVLLAVYGDAGVDGVIEIGSAGPDAGAGGSWSGCGNGTGAAGVGNAYSGGGAGGALGPNGGNGGKDQGGTAATHGTGLGGAGNPLVPLRGGCAGGDGGDQAAGQGGIPGAGGGAFQLSVAANLEVSGGVWASGGGGGPGNLAAAGGGGGGSGGAILLEANRLTLIAGASLAANGGAGGGGASAIAAGGPGQDGTDSGVQATGGTGNGGCGVGGSGGGGNGANGQNGCISGGPNGGGGGGGSGGIIRLNSPHPCTLPGGIITSPGVSKGSGC